MKRCFCQKTEYNQKDVDCFVSKYGFDVGFAQILSSRGLKESDLDRYFNFSYNNFYNPYDMLNMDKAVSLIQTAMTNNYSILVYGDYDADGLTASCILKLFFANNGVDCDILIPTRNDGYGLHVDLVKQAFAKKNYGLVITVDCGVSNKDEIAQILAEIDTTIVVTDHHELPEVLPNCVCVNPKLGYHFPDLSGAGVALKVVQALIGIENSVIYADLASIGTIADMMPLCDENRDIVKLGLANFNHKGLIKLAEAGNCPSPTAVDVAMRIAPKINAAGRVGDLDVAIKLLSDQLHCQKEDVESLIFVNEKRRTLVDEFMLVAERKLADAPIYEDGVIFLYDEDWNKGVLGIVASKFKEKYNLPSIVMGRDGDNYVGSARGTEDTDLHSIFTRCNDLLVKFGGHKASVGFTVHKDNLVALHQRIISIISDKQNESTDLVSYYDLPFETRYLSKEFSALLEKMQPMLPNDKPVFYFRGFCRSVNLFGQDKSHIRIMLDNDLEVKGFFKFFKYYDALCHNAECELLFVLEYDTYVKKTIGLLRQIKINNSLYFDNLYAENVIAKLQFDTPEKTLNTNQVRELLKKNTLAVFNSYVEYEYYANIFDFSNYYVDIFAQSNRCSQGIIIAPISQNVFSEYKNVICFNRYDGIYAKYSQNGEVYYYKTKSSLPAYLNCKIDRNICAQVYSALRQKVFADGLLSLYNSISLRNISYPQFLLAMRVFSELKIVEIFQPFSYKFVVGVTAELTNSPTFNFFSK